ncbi:MAG: KpsF/GutQ family sugar-phosphate isomerase [Nitrospiraceae bacterium]|nr:KpsF/GutQ family sugar-phosphate isomerase [Nitrospiraceae bacterium]
MKTKDSKEIIEEAKRVLKTEAQAILELAGTLDSGFAAAVDRIHCCKGRVIVTGMGKSGLVGKKIAATFSSVGVASHFLHPAEAIHGDLGMVKGSDLVLALSNSGETEEVVAIIPHLKRFNVFLVAMSGNPASTLAGAADIHICVKVRQEACPMGIVPTSSTTAALAMGDALAVALIKKKGFGEEDFACLHPGGSLGKKLLIKVGDLMVKGKNIPRVPEAAGMADAVVEISSKKLGLALVTDRAGAVKGIITDGDLRRAIGRRGKEVFDMKAADVMTGNPKTIRAGELAAKALSVMQAHSITSLVVVDAAGMPEGIIHIHDILKKGIA